MKINFNSHSTIFLITLSLIGLSSFIAHAQTSTLSNGLWNSGANWSNGVPAAGTVADISKDMTLNTNLNIGNGGSYTVNNGSITDPVGGSKYNLSISGNGNMDISGNVTLEGDFTLQNNSSITIRGCDTLRIGGDVEFKNNSSLEIESCAVMIVDGNVEFKNNNNNQIDGNLSIGGDLETKNNASVSGTGLVEVSGEVEIKNNSNLFGSTSGCSPGPCEYGSGAGLPITLHSFSTEWLKSGWVEIKWKTSSEINNDYFTLEGSVDGKEFHTLKTIKGAGNSNVLLSYSTLVKPMTDDVHYIRLKQTDFDGQFEVFPPKAVKPLENNSLSKLTKSESEIKLFPNPGNGSELQLEFKPTTSGDYQIQIINANGQIIKQSSFFLDSNESIIRRELLQGTKLIEGLYFIRIQNNAESKTIKHIVN